MERHKILGDKVVLYQRADGGNWHTYGREQLREISKMINAEKSDLFDVPAYIAFAMATVTRLDRVSRKKAPVLSSYDDKLQDFLDFVLGQYVERGIDELDSEKLPALLELKYRAVADAAKELGGAPRIREVFVGFQRDLFERGADAN